MAAIILEEGARDEKAAQWKSRRSIFEFPSPLICILPDGFEFIYIYIYIIVFKLWMRAVVNHNYA